MRSAGHTRCIPCLVSVIPGMFHACCRVFPVAHVPRSQPRLQAQVDVGVMSSRLEDFQLQGAMCLGAALAQYGEVGKYSKHRCESTRGTMEVAPFGQIVPD